MKFRLIDRIIEFDSGERIVAVKAVSLAEEYLADHFPTFPVLPGVFMLEAMTEAASWLIREAQNFATGLILLGEARNVTYKNFVKPGDLLRVEVTCRRLARDESEFSGVGYRNRDEVVRGRFTLRHPPSVADAGGVPVGQRAEVARGRFALLFDSSGTAPV